MPRSSSVLRVVPQPSLVSRDMQKAATSAQKDLFVAMLHFGSDIYREYRIRERLKEKGLAEDAPDAWNLFMQLLIFLWLEQVKPKSVRWSPPARIDAAWHEFILFTEAYAAFCEKAVGHFIHHAPITTANRKEMESRRPWLYSLEKKEKFCGKEIPFMPKYWQEPPGTQERPCDGGGH